jgi:hypothetical protein
MSTLASTSAPRFLRGQPLDRCLQDNHDMPPPLRGPSFRRLPVVDFARPGEQGLAYTMTVRGVPCGL